MRNTSRRAGHSGITMKQLSVKGLADFMTVSASRQRKILRDHKYPAEDEPRAKILYYREARDRIAGYHKGKKDLSWLEDEAERLEFLANVSDGARKTRLKNNSRGLRSYAKNFAQKNFEILGDLPMDLVFGDVRITAFPDLQVRENGAERIIRLDFSRPDLKTNGAKRETITIITQTMLMACEQNGIEIDPKDILYFDVESKQISEARKLSRVRGDIEATCQNVSDIWDGI